MIRKLPIASSAHDAKKATSVSSSIDADAVFAQGTKGVE